MGNSEYIFIMYVNKKYFSLNMSYLLILFNSLVYMYFGDHLALNIYKFPANQSPGKQLLKGKFFIAL